MTRLYLVRHAKAGERRLWTGDDVDRPLSKKGWKQAELVGKRLAKIPATQLLTSPYVRCIQTLEPLGKRLDLPIAVDQRLCEDEPIPPVLDLIATAPDGTVMSSHGDIIPGTIMALKKGGTQLRTSADWRKASVWVLKRNKHGAIVHATVWPPPQIG